MNRRGLNHLVTQQNFLFPRRWVILHPAYNFYGLGDDLHPQTHVDAMPLENRAAARAALQADRSSHGEKLAAAQQHLSAVPVENRDFIQSVTRLDGQWLIPPSGRFERHRSIRNRTRHRGLSL